MFLYNIVIHEDISIFFNYNFFVYQARFDFRIFYPIQISFVWFILLPNQFTVSWLFLFVRYWYLAILSFRNILSYVSVQNYHAWLALYFYQFLLLMCIYRDLILEYYIQSKSRLFCLSYDPIKFTLYGWWFNLFPTKKSHYYQNVIQKLYYFYHRYINTFLQIIG